MTQEERTSQLAAVLEALLRVVADIATAADPAFVKTHHESLSHMAALVEEVRQAR